MPSDDQEVVGAKTVAELTEQVRAKEMSGNKKGVGFRSLSFFSNAPSPGNRRQRQRFFFLVRLLSSFFRVSLSLTALVLLSPREQDGLRKKISFHRRVWGITEALDSVGTKHKKRC